MTILIAEADLLMSSTIEQRLTKDGHKLIITHDGREALRKLARSAPDLIITHIMLPFVSGLEIVAAAKKRKDKKIMVIVLSEMGQENTLLKALQLGIDDYVTKPFSPKELLVRVRKFLPLVAER